MKTAEKKLWKIGGALAAAAAVMAFLSYVYTWTAYYDTLPHSPDMATGRVYTDNFHGFARYETQREHARLHSLGHLSELLVFLLVVGGALHEWRTRRPDGRPLVVPTSPGASPRRGGPSP